MSEEENKKDANFEANEWIAKIEDSDHHYDEEYQSDHQK
jgi:hypothetical protein